MHPTPKSCVLILGLGFRFLEGGSGVIAVPLAWWRFCVAGIKPNL